MSQESSDQVSTGSHDQYEPHRSFAQIEPAAIMTRVGDEAEHRRAEHQLVEPGELLVRRLRPRRARP